MQLLSVNIGQPRTQQNGRKLETTGIYKLPAQEPTQVKELGIAGDFIGSQKDHGGPDQAVYIYGEPDYEWWSKELGKQLEPGTFGDNLTLSDFESARYSIGDRLHIGSVILEFTAPRIPCSTLATRMGDPMFVKRYRYAERPGMYCRVIQEGTLEAGDTARLEPYSGETIMALDLFRDHYQDQKDEETLRRILRAPIAIRTRADVEADLQKLLSRS